MIYRVTAFLEFSRITALLQRDQTPELFAVHQVATVEVGEMDSQGLNTNEHICLAQPRDGGSPHSPPGSLLQAPPCAPEKEQRGVDKAPLGCSYAGGNWLPLGTGTVCHLLPQTLLSYETDVAGRAADPLAPRP